MGKQLSDASGERERAYRRQWGWSTLAGVVIVGFLGVMLVSGCGSEPEQSNNASPREASPMSEEGASKANERSVGCETDDSDQSTPARSPEDMRWKTYGTTPVPVSATYGPTKFDGAVWWCYSHTPMGAVMAAHSITDHLSYPGWREVAERQMAPGVNRDKYIAERATHTDTPRNAAQIGANYAGFSVLAYTKDQATVQALVEVSGKGYASMAVNVKWSDGDWKLDLQPDGSFVSSATEVTETQGFVMWGK